MYYVKGLDMYKMLCVYVYVAENYDRDKYSLILVVVMSAIYFQQNG